MSHGCFLPCMQITSGISFCCRHYISFHVRPGLHYSFEPTDGINLQHMDVTETIIQDSATGRLYLWVSCEGPIPFPMNVPGIACLKILYADFLGLMALSNSVHPTCMFKHIGVANVLVHLAKPQLHCMYTHFRLGFLIQNICKCGFAKCLLHSLGYKRR